MRAIKLLAMTMMMLSFSGCALFSSTPHANITLQSARYLNPDINGRASPVVITFYQLKNDYTFKQADSTSLMANSAQILGNDLIDKNTIEVRPNSTQTIKQDLDPAAQYLGIVAAYRNSTTESWHKVLKLDTKHGKRADITISLQSQGFTIINN